MLTLKEASARDRLLAAMPVTERRLKLAGVATAVVEGGDGPALVLLHGPGEFAAKWLRAQVKRAAAHEPVVVAGCGPRAEANQAKRERRSGSERRKAKRVDQYQPTAPPATPRGIARSDRTAENVAHEHRPQVAGGGDQLIQPRERPLRIEATVGTLGGAVPWQVRSDHPVRRDELRDPPFAGRDGRAVGAV
jgi:hypothetical protein